MILIRLTTIFGIILMGTLFIPSNGLKRDYDRDGFIPGADCDETNAAVHKDAKEICDGVDNNCNGHVPPDDVDADGDGILKCAGDCDDLDRNVYPNAPERCDGVDNNCNHRVDENFADFDRDSQTDCIDLDDDNDGDPDASDCDDQNAAIFTDASELCDGVDNNCSDSTDEDFDEDGDTYNGCGGDDCDDLDHNVYPGAPEIPDFKDNDCDSSVDEGTIFQNRNVYSSGPSETEPCTLALQDFCDEEDGNTICRALPRRERETILSVHRFLEDIQRVTPTSRDPFICARLIGSEIAFVLFLLDPSASQYESRRTPNEASPIGCCIRMEAFMTYGSSIVWMFTGLGPPAELGKIYEQRQQIASYGGDTERTTVLAAMIGRITSVDRRDGGAYPYTITVEIMERAVTIDDKSPKVRLEEYRDRVRAMEDAILAAGR